MWEVCGFDSSGSGSGLVEGVCKYSNESFGSVKGGGGFGINRATDSFSTMPPIFFFLRNVIQDLLQL